MYKRILFSTCMTEYCGHVFTFALNTAKENNAKLWIYHGLGRLNLKFLTQSSLDADITF